MSARIQELAVPKGKVSSLCEICGQKATTKCEKCKVTHYCSEYHKKVDYKSFHRNVCQEIFHIRKEHPLPFTEEDRKEADEAIMKKKHEIQLLAEITTRKWLLHENAEYAYPAARSALNIARGLHGSNSVHVIYPTCLVSEACLRLGDIKTSQEYVVVASWISQKYIKIPHTIFARLMRLTGLVCMGTEKWDQARGAFAECLYAISVEHGISDIRTAVAYGHLGLTLMKDNNKEGAMDSFHKMADKWLEHLLARYEEKILRGATDVEMVTDEKIRELEFQYLESRIVFKWIYEDVRRLGMNAVTDLINFKILSIQALSKIRDGMPDEAVVYKDEALATGTRTKQDKAVPKHRVSTLIDVLGDDYLLRWEKKHNRPRTVATKYLEMIKAINV